MFVRVNKIMNGAIAATMLVLGACHPARQPAPAPQFVRVRMETSKGVFVLETNRAWAPIGVDRFLALVRAHFFDDSRFFRVRDKFIAQFGIAGHPAVTREWNGRYIPDDSVRTSNARGTFAYAMTGPNLRNTQIFISTVDNKQLDAQGFAPIGRVVEGMDVVDQIYSGYGENSGGGLRAGHQERLLGEGNAYLDTAFPKLDHLIRATIVR